MKSNLSFTLEGRDWWKPYLLYWIIVIAVEIVMQTSGSSTAWGKAHPEPALVIQLGFALVLWFVAMVFVIVFLRIIAPKLSCEGESFVFQGKIGEYIWLNVVGILLSIVTVGIFLPWYMRRVTDYMASKTSWRGTPLSFLGRGGRLFAYMLIGFWAPLIALIVVILLAVGVSASRGMKDGDPGSVQLVTMLVTFFFVLYILLVFIYLLYKWIVDISWRDVRVGWRTKFWPSFGLILGQVTLSLITVTVYWPAAYLRLYRYFIERTVLTRGEADIGRMGFEGDPRKGFGLIWGQTLLAIITLGVYAPWAYANIGRWLVGATFVERTDR
jgi:uncharacterized membrane protein YjgN (DUF898 family)